MTVYERYLVLKDTWSDVQIHLPRLYEASKGIVVELGVRGGNSTTALLAGVEQHGGHLWSVDIDASCGGLYNGHPQWTFVHCDSEQVRSVLAAGLMPPVDVLFIDTVHTYEKTIMELVAWMPIMRKGGRVFLHDTDDGSTYPGVRQAIHEFCQHQKFYWLHPGSYGLGEIEC